MNTSSNSSSRSPRFNKPERAQVEWRPFALDQLLPWDHRARVIWKFVDSLDLSPLHEKVRAVEGEPGRNAVDPRILMSLWMLATLEGISSARQLERLCERDLAYMWICGNVGVNYHLLADFRVAHGEFLEQLLTDSVATLLHQNLVTLDTVAQDGMRVRANAGSSSFRREKTLRECRDEARQQVEKLSQERDDDSGGSSTRREEAARQRATKEQEERLVRALEELKKLQAQKEKNKKGSGDRARVSTTDPEARIMKMADGGFRPAYNVQFATDGASRIILGVEVSSSGSDRGQMAPMHQSLVEMYGKTPGKYLVDGAFTTREDVTSVEKGGTEVYGPIYNEKKLVESGENPYERKKQDTDEMFAFRQRMAADEAKQECKQRGSIAEFPNAVCRNHGLHQFPVRGRTKAKAVALWHALAHNFMRTFSLGYLT